MSMIEVSLKYRGSFIWEILLVERDLFENVKSEALTWIKALIKGVHIETLKSLSNEISFWTRNVGNCRKHSKVNLPVDCMTGNWSSWAI